MEGVRKHFGHRRQYLTTIQQLALDELLKLEKEIQQSKGVKTTGYIGIDDHVLKLRRFFLLIPVRGTRLSLSLQKHTMYVINCALAYCVGVSAVWVTLTQT